MVAIPEQDDSVRSAGGGSLRVDVHCHCLPGIDDGPANTQEAIELCRALVIDGFTDVIATPHQLGRFDGRNDAQTVRTAVTQLRQLLERERMPLRIHPGGDIRIDERLPRMLQDGVVNTLADAGRYLLLELPHEIYVDPTAILMRLLDMGYVPIITHPERHQYLQRHPATVVDWVALGAMLQITAGSVIGDFGSQAQAASARWISEGLVTLVATDAHDTTGRPPRMSAAISAIEHKHGVNMARTLCIENPACLLRPDHVSRSISGPVMASEAGAATRGPVDAGRRRLAVVQSVA